jgi:opacity protein-like surface antigen
MRLSPLLLLGCVLAAVIASAALAASPSVRPKVTPKDGTARTAFKVSFKTREATGTVGVINRHYAVEISRKRPPKGCSPGAYAKVKKTKAGANVRVTLRPGKRRWCKGKFAGRVYLVSENRCRITKQTPCPSFPSERQQVGRFSVQVR